MKLRNCLSTWNIKWVSINSKRIKVLTVISETSKIQVTITLILSYNRLLKQNPNKLITRQKMAKFGQMKIKAFLFFFFLNKKHLKKWNSQQTEKYLWKRWYVSRNMKNSYKFFKKDNKPNRNMFLHFHSKKLLLV